MLYTSLYIYFDTFHNDKSLVLLRTSHEFSKRNCRSWGRKLIVISTMVLEALREKDKRPFIFGEVTIYLNDFNGLFALYIDYPVLNMDMITDASHILYIHV